MSKVNDIKNIKRQQKAITPIQVLTEIVGEEEIIQKQETNIDSKQPINTIRKRGGKVERKRVSFDLRTDIHKELKMQSLIQEKNIYLLIEEALTKYLNENKQ